MRRVSWQITEEGSVSVLLDELHRFIEPDIRAITGERLWLAVAQVGIVKIVISPIVGRLTDAPAAMDSGDIESPVLRSERIVISQLPLAEDACSVSV